MRTLLFPTDFSEEMENVEKFAVEMARAIDAKLYLVHIDNRAKNEPVTNSYREHYTEENIKKSYYSQLESIVEKYGIETLPHACLTREGNVAETILSLVEDLDVDMVVMGTSGNDNFDRIYCNATEVISKAKCSVMTIPKGVTYQPLKSIVYATDLVHRDLSALDHLTRIAEAFDAHMTILHVDIDGMDLPGDGPLMSLTEFKEKINYSKLATKVLIASSLMVGLEKHLAEQPTALLAMTSHSKTFLNIVFHQTNIEKIVLSSHVPMLFF